VGPGILKPLENLEPAFVGQRPQAMVDRHIANLLIAYIFVKQKPRTP
jgi:hypothetical protein